MKGYCRYCVDLNIAYGDGDKYLCNLKRRYVHLYNMCKEFTDSGLDENNEPRKGRQFYGRRAKINDGEQVQISENDNEQ